MYLPLAKTAVGLGWIPLPIARESETDKNGMTMPSNFSEAKVVIDLWRTNTQKHPFACLGPLLFPFFPSFSTGYGKLAGKVVHLVLVQQHASRSVPLCLYQHVSSCRIGTISSR